MRRAIAQLAFLAGAVLVLASATPAYADPGNGNGNGNGNDPPGQSKGNGNDQSPPGNNGTIKIHDPNENEPIRANEPHPGCTFHIHGFNFDGGSSGTWQIQSWPPTGDKSVVKSGTWGPASSSGEWRTGDMSDLASGHYKASAKQTSPMAPGDSKHKVFWIECGGQQGGGDQGGGEQGAQDQGGQNQGQAVAGFEQAPQAGVSPIVESSAVAPMTFEQAVANQQAQAAAAAAAQAQLGAQALAGVQTVPGGAGIAGAESAPMQPLELAGLPSTSTAGIPAIFGALGLFGFAFLIRRRM